MRKIYLFTGIFLLLFTEINTLCAQKMTLSQYEDSINLLISEIKIAKTDSGKIELNTKIENLFGDVLQNEESFNYPFDSLKNISKLKSEDGLVRIINWNLPLANGNYTYFAYIQHLDKKERMKLFRLIDKSDEIAKPENRELSDKKWYGALYYKILTNRSGKNTYYTVLGWDGNNDFTNKKIIDVLLFSDNKITFGPPVFNLDKNIRNRLIFEFAEQSQMMLRYDDQLKMIVFDHLAPIQKKFEGQYMYYGPDMSQDGLKFEKGTWEFIPNLDLRNINKIKGRPVQRSNKITGH